MDKHQATKNVRSLSGGERSFATVSFVMALWDAIDSPFRCLDEFDVFMDLINRRVSMQLMLEEATLNGSKQFIFFTPQDMRYMYPSIYLSMQPIYVYVSFHLTVDVSIHLSIHISLPIHVSFHLSIYSINLSIYYDFLVLSV